MQNDGQYWLDMLKGKTLRKIRYVECIGSDEPHWNQFTLQLDSVELGVELETSDGYVFGIIWQQVTFEVGLHLMRGSVQEVFENATVWDVTQNSRWTAFLSLSIKDVVLHWSYEQSETTTIPYPRTLQLLFSDDSVVYLSAAEYLPDSDTLMKAAEEVTVIFDKVTAEHFGIGGFK